jgi:WD40 repeat protein
MFRFYFFTFLIILQVFLISCTHGGIAVSPGAIAVGLGGYLSFESRYHHNQVREAKIADELDKECVSYSVAFSPDGRYLASSGNMNVCLWEIGSGKLVRAYKVPLPKESQRMNAEMVAVAFSPDGGYIVGGRHDGTLHLWDVHTGVLRMTFGGYVGGIRTVAFSPDGRYIASGGHETTVRLWETESGNEVRAFEGHNGMVESIRFSPDGRMIVSGCTDGSVRLWEVKTGKQLGQYDLGQHDGLKLPASVRFAGFSPDGRKIHIVESDGSIGLWEIATDRRVRLSGERKNRYGFPADLSPDGKFIILGAGDDYGLVGLENAENGTEIKVFQKGEIYVRGLAFSPNGKDFASTGGDGKIWLWNIQESAPIKEFNATETLD